MLRTSWNLGKIPDLQVHITRRGKCKNMVVTLKRPPWRHDCRRPLMNIYACNIKHKTAMLLQIRRLTIRRKNLVLSVDICRALFAWHFIKQHVFYILNSDQILECNSTFEFYGTLWNMTESGLYYNMNRCWNNCMTTLAH